MPAKKTASIKDLVAAEKMKEANKEQEAHDKRIAARKDVEKRCALQLAGALNAYLGTKLTLQDVEILGPEGTDYRFLAKCTVDGYHFGMYARDHGTVRYYLVALKQCEYCSEWLQSDLDYGDHVTKEAFIARLAAKEGQLPVYWRNPQTTWSRPETHECAYEGFALVDKRSGAERILNNRGRDQALVEALATLGYEVVKRSIMPAKKVG